MKKQSWGAKTQKIGVTAKNLWGMFELVWQVQPGYFMGLLVLELIQGIAPIGSALLTKLMFDLLAQLFQEGSVSEYTKNLTFLLLGQIILNLASHALGIASTYLSSELERQLSLRIQLIVYRKINSLAGLAVFESPDFHDTVRLSVQGALMGPERLLYTFVGLLRSAITLVSFLGILFTFNPLLAILVVLSALPQLFAKLKLGQERFNMANRNSPKERRVGHYGSILSAIPFLKEVRLFNLANYFLQLFKLNLQELHQRQRLQQIKELSWQFRLGLLSNLVSNATFAIVILQAFTRKITLGDVTLFTNAVGSIQSSLFSFISSLAEMHESALFFTRYTDLLALPQPIAIPPSPLPTPPLTHSVELRDVSFRYSAEHPWIFRNLTLTLPAGQALALVGLNGAGKTTLVKLLTRLYDPTEGKILWDGVDIREFDPADLRRRMGVIFQDFVRFDLTALENIALGDVTKLENGNRAAAETAARRAAQKAGIHEMVAALPHGYHTTLSRWLAEDGQGVDLSGGEWQKIALARLFMRDADLLILDEPTAALDAQAEYDIYQSFTDIVAGKTSLLISHRFSTVRMADLIAVLDDGKITEYGAHDALMAQGGTYARLYNLQAERYR